MFEVNIWVVLAIATATALATGLGALPFLFLNKVSDWWMAVFSAAAAGLMLAASHSLVAEGIELSAQRTLLGLIIGLVAIVISHRVITNGRTPEIANLTGLNASRALLVVGIMTAHSFAEGIGVGVSFGGGTELATYISAAI
ncbi:MAG: ZIP family metal transporter, partial [Alphaproteobacteria bacterium]|nr:ZIP family metal transporter [Alphaproteobacteria bacterium]